MFYRNGNTPPQKENTVKIQITLASSLTELTAASGSYTPAQKAKVGKINDKLAEIRKQLERFKDKIDKLKAQWASVRKRRQGGDSPKLKAAETSLREEIGKVRESTAPMRAKRAKLLADRKAIRVAAGFKASLKKKKKKVYTKTKQKAAKMKLKK